MSGILAEYGLAARNGIELARLDHPDLFSRVDFVFDDSQWDAKTAVTAFNTLTQVKKVSLVFNWGNPTTEAIAPIAERQGVPLIGMTLDPKPVLGKTFVIRSINPAAEFSGQLVGYLKQKGYRRLGVVLADNTYVQGLFNGVKASLSPEQSIEVIAQHNITESDFRSTILRAAQKKYDAIGVFLISGQVSTFYRQLRDQKVTVPTFGTDFFECTTEIGLAGGGMEGSVYPHLGITDSFAREYVDRFGNDYQIAYAGNAYDMAVLIGTLFNGEQAKPSPEQILSALKGPKSSLNGVAGSFHYQTSAERDSYYQFPMQLKVIQGDRFHVLN